MIVMQADKTARTVCLRALLAVAAGLAVGFIPAKASADKIVLLNGREITGVIEASTPERVTLKTAQGVVSFATSTVASQIRDSAQQNQLVCARLALSKGDFANGLSLLNALDGTPEEISQADDILRQVSEQLVSAAPSVSREDVNRFAKYVTSRSTPPPEDIRFLLVRFLAARGDSPQATDYLRTLPQDFLLSSSQARKTAADILLTDIKHNLTSGAPDSSLQNLETLSRIAPDTLGTASVTFLYLGESGKLTQGAHYDKALALLGQHVQPTAPALAFKEALRVLEEAQRHTSGSRLMELYESVEHDYSAQFCTPELVEVYEKHARQLTDSAHFDEADALADRLSALDAEAGARLQHRVEFLRRKSQTAPSDILANYRLGTWAKERKLNEEALEQFRRVQNAPELRENAKLQIELIELERQKNDFALVQEEFDNGHYEQAIRSAQEFCARHPEGDYAKKAQTAIELARYRMRKASELRPAEADALYQNAERLALQGRSAEAWTALNRLATDYADTPASRQAEALRSRVTRDLQTSGGSNLASASSKRPPKARNSAEATARRSEEIRALSKTILGL